MNTKNVLQGLGLAAGLGISSPALMAQSILVPTFGPLSSITENAGDYNNITTSTTFGDSNGWTVASGNVDLIGTYWTSPDGNVSVDLDGQAPGAISTSVSVPTAGLYSVSFDLAGNPDGGAAEKTLQVQLGSATAQTLYFNTTGNSDISMGWTAETAYFYITSTGAQTLTFTSLDDPSSDAGPALGTVTVASAPEPGTLALAGVGMSALLAFRRRK